MGWIHYKLLLFSYLLHYSCRTNNSLGLQKVSLRNHQTTSCKSQILNANTEAPLTVILDFHCLHQKMKHQTSRQCSDLHGIPLKKVIWLRCAAFFIIHPIVRVSFCQCLTHNKYPNQNAWLHSPEVHWIKSVPCCWIHYCTLDEDQGLVFFVVPLSKLTGCSNIMH